MEDGNNGNLGWWDCGGFEILYFYIWKKTRNKGETARRLPVHCSGWSCPRQLSRQVPLIPRKLGPSAWCGPKRAGKLLLMPGPIPLENELSLENGLGLRLQQAWNLGLRHHVWMRFTVAEVSTQEWKKMTLITHHAIQNMGPISKAHHLKMHPRC